MLHIDPVPLVPSNEGSREPSGDENEDEPKSAPLKNDVAKSGKDEAASITVDPEETGRKRKRAPRRKKGELNLPNLNEKAGMTDDAIKQEQWKKQYFVSRIEIPPDCVKESVKGFQIRDIQQSHVV